MRRGLDTNVLIYAHMPELPDHARVRSFLLDQLEDEGVTLVITPIILHEFCTSSPTEGGSTRLSPWQMPSPWLGCISTTPTWSVLA